MFNSIIARLRISMYAFGIFMGLVFPIYANFFVDWKDGLHLYFSIGSFIAGLSIGIFAFLMVKLILLKEINRIDDFANSLGDNDLTARININSKDSVGRIASNLSDSTTQIHGIVSTIVNTAKQLIEALSNLLFFSKNMTESSKEISEKSNNTLNNMITIDQSTTEISNSMKSISNNSYEIVESTKDLAKSQDIISKNVSQETNIAQKVKEQVGETKEAISELNIYSKDIATIVDTIKSIADQTNILAINAAVEAARAGIHGKSFAIVANEVKDLADKSLKSASEVDSLIGKISSLIEKSHVNVQSSDKMVTELDILAKSVTKETTSQNIILESFENKINSINTNINRAAENLSLGSDSLSTATNDVRYINQQINKISTDISNGTSTIINLNSLAIDLDSLTSKFTV